MPPEVRLLISRKFSLKHEVFPIDKLGPILTVGMVCPLDTNTRSELETMTGLRVSALLCSPADIRIAINRNFGDGGGETGPSGLGSSAKLQGISAMVDKIDSLPALPQTVQKNRQALDDPEVNLREVSEIISADPALAAKLLQLANSAAYGLPRLVGSVHSAVTLLGLKETYAVALALAVVDLMESAGYFDYDRFRGEANFTTSIANNLAQACWKKRRHGIFTAGLLHDIGRFALSEVVPGRYKKIDLTLDGAALVALVALVAQEYHLLGIAHPEAGNILAESWNLPDDIAQAIRFHHMPEHASREKEFVALVALDAHLKEVYRTGGEPEVDAVGEIHETLDMDAGKIREIYRETVRGLAEESA